MQWVLTYEMHWVFCFSAGNINQSLMTLRTCIEVLRENQMCGTNKVFFASSLLLFLVDHMVLW